MTPSPSRDTVTKSMGTSRSRSWTETTSAAAFVLRYLPPIRSRLIGVLGSENEADEALKLLLNHLISVGFGNHKRGRLRDFVHKAVRSAVKARAEAVAGKPLPNLDRSQLTADSPEWLRLWRDGVLERVWRELERREHADPTTPEYSVLHAAVRAPDDNAAMLAVRVASDYGMALDERQVSAILPVARRHFARLLADEIASTLDRPDKEQVKEEVKILGLTSAFKNLDN